MCIRDRGGTFTAGQLDVVVNGELATLANLDGTWSEASYRCLLYTSDAADDLLCVDLGGRRIIKKKKYDRKPKHHTKHTRCTLNT